MKFITLNVFYFKYQLWITYAPIDDISSKYYGVSPFKINWLSLVFPIAALPFSMVSAWFIDTYGLKGGVGVCSEIYCFMIHLVIHVDTFNNFMNNYFSRYF